MWKFVTRGIRETLERRACRTNVYSQTSQDNGTKGEVKQSLTCQHKILTPSTGAFNKGFCGSAKTGGTKDNDDQTKWNARHTWFEAVGWSSVLAVGWVVCQTLCLHRKFYEKDQLDGLRNKLSQFSEIRLSHLFGHVLKLDPNIFPVVHCAGNDFQQSEEDTEWTLDKPFGPITAEEALKEATDEFEKVHKFVLGEFELHSGIRAIEEKRYEDAVQHFTAGAGLSSLASMFNLALCYEQGLGTVVDHAKAAKWYSDAAEQGHADAMYNLGVFHAQGRGGFSVDVNRARNYFVRAAALGQTQAQEALELEKQSRKNSDVFQDISEESETIADQIVALNLRKHSEDNFDDVSETKSPTETFLGYLGINESNLVPVGVNPKDCCVPC